jgi:hypothetical protein
MEPACPCPDRSRAMQVVRLSGRIPGIPAGPMTQQGILSRHSSCLSPFANCYLQLFANCQLQPIANCNLQQFARTKRTSAKGQTLKACHPDRSRATQVVRLSGRIPGILPASIPVTGNSFEKSSCLSLANCRLPFANCQLLFARKQKNFGQRPAPLKPVILTEAARRKS